jgi:hypothetical protein
MHLMVIAGSEVNRSSEVATFRILLKSKVREVEGSPQDCVGHVHQKLVRI